MLDYIAGIMELIGLWKVGKKSRWGFIYNILCNLAWTAFVFVNDFGYGLLIVVLPAIGINIKNFIIWSKKKKPKITWYKVTFKRGNVKNGNNNTK